MTPQRWIIAFGGSIAIHALLLLSLSFSHLTHHWFETPPHDPHLIVIQELMTQTDRPSDENYVWSSADHFEPKQKPPQYLQSQPREGHDTEAPQSGTGLFSTFKNLFEVPSSEHHPDLGEDAELLLNTRKYKHYSFFKRVYDKLYPLWISELQNRQAQWRDHTEGYYLTRIRIRMDPIGYLTQKDILLSSHVTWVDESALGALERAQPYPNPPDDFLMPTEENPIKTYEFIYEFLFELRTSGLRYHLYRATP